MAGRGRRTDWGTHHNSSMNRVQPWSTWCRSPQTTLMRPQRSRLSRSIQMQTGNASGSRVCTEPVLPGSQIGNTAAHAIGHAQIIQDVPPGSQVASYPTQWPGDKVEQAKSGCQVARLCDRIAKLGLKVWTEYIVYCKLHSRSRSVVIQVHWHSLADDSTEQPVDALLLMREVPTPCLMTDNVVCSLNA